MLVTRAVLRLVPRQRTAKLHTITRKLPGNRSTGQDRKCDVTKTATLSASGSYLKSKRPLPLILARNLISVAGKDDTRVISSPYPDVPMPDVPLHQFVMEKFPKFGDNVAFIEGPTGRTITYAQLQTQVAQVASGLTKMGLTKGDVITIFSPNVPEFGVTYLANSTIGGVTSTVNPLYTADELMFALTSTASKVLVTVPVLLGVAKQAAANSPTVQEIIIFGEGEDARPFASLLDDDITSLPSRVDLDPESDLACLPFSSGTTGLPKGVMLSHSAIAANVKQLSNSGEAPIYTPDDVIMGVLPFFHIYGQVVVMFAGLSVGARVVTVPKFEPEPYLRMIQEYKATFLPVVPPILLLLTSHPLVDEYDMSTVDTLFTGAAPVSADTCRKVIDRLKTVKIRQGFGLTEASPVTHIQPATSDQYHAVGVAVCNTQYKIVDTESGKSLGPMEEGELVVRGPQLMKGYLNDPQSTAHTIRDGWLHTGDIGYYQEDGFCVISDRLKELIKVKGLQVAPAELEGLLLQHPLVSDVAVIGIPDDLAGELPRAYVVLKPNNTASQEDITSFLDGKIAQYKQLLGGVEFRAEIPKSGTGKILRRLLKDEYMEGLREQR